MGLRPAPKKSPDEGKRCSRHQGALLRFKINRIGLSVYRRAGGLRTSESLLRFRNSRSLRLSAGPVFFPWNLSTGYSACLVRVAFVMTLVQHIMYSGLFIDGYFPSVRPDSSCLVHPFIKLIMFMYKI